MADVLNKKLETVHSEIMSALYRHGELHYTYSEQYQEFKSNDYFDAFQKIIGAN